MPNQWTKAKETGIPYIIKDSTRKKLSNAATEKNLKYFSSKENRDKHSDAMKLAVEKFPNSYTSSNRGRTKQIVYDGIKFQGRWELDFYKWCISENIQIKRCEEFFEYKWNGIRKYFPDFFLPEQNLYVEIKGYETERDQAKWSQFPKKLFVVKRKEILQIKKGNFNKATLA